MRRRDYAVINKKHNFHHRKYDIDSAIYFLFYRYYLYEKSFSSLKAKKKLVLKLYSNFFRIIISIKKIKST